MSTCVRSSRVSRVLAAAAIAALASTATAAAGPERYTIHRTAADDAAARTATLTRPDVGSASGWSGGPTKPDLTPNPGCPNFHPKQSDLVITGAAAATFKNVAFQMHSESQVMKTARMMQLDWQRSVLPPNSLSCARRLVARTSTKTTRFVSLGLLAIPKLTPYTAGYRALFDVTTAKGKIRMAYDIVLVGRGRTEITLATTMPLSVASTVWIMEMGIAGTLAGRARA
jgi:hypothetical protein